jgi:hypothetical protein
MVFSGDVLLLLLQLFFHSARSPTHDLVADRVLYNNSSNTDSMIAGIDIGGLGMKMESGIEERIGAGR